jgi:hypothetical protein
VFGVDPSIGMLGQAWQVVCACIEAEEKGR